MADRAHIASEECFNSGSRRNGPRRAIRDLESTAFSEPRTNCNESAESMRLPWWYACFRRLPSSR